MAIFDYKILQTFWSSTIHLPVGFFSFRGDRNGLDASNGVNEPLIHEKSDKDSNRKRESPNGKATFLQQITFSWLNPLFAVGYNKPLEQDEIPGVDIGDSAGFLSTSFDVSLNQVKEKDRTSNPSIYKAIFLFTRKKAAINALFAVTSAAASYIGPSLFDEFVNFLTQKKSRNLESGYLLALGFLGAKTMETIAQRQWIFGAHQLGLHLRASLISHIHKKSLVLSSQSRRNDSSGEIVNYMSVDIQRITDIIRYLNYIYMDVAHANFLSNLHSADKSRFGSGGILRD